MSIFNSSTTNGISSCLSEKNLLDKNISYLDKKEKIYPYTLKKYETKNIYNKLNSLTLKVKDKYKNFFIFENREKNFQKKKNKYRINLNLKKFHFPKKDNDNNSKPNSIYITENKIKGDFTKLPLLLEKLNDYQLKKISNNKSLNISKNDNNISKEINKKYLSKSIEKDKEKAENDKNKNSNVRTLFLNKLKFNLEKDDPNRKHISKTTSYILNKKNSLLNARKFLDRSRNSYIDKLNEYIISKNNFELKNERYTQINEFNTNKIEELNVKINSMKKSYEIFENKFLTKYNEYYRTINNERDHQNNIDLNLCEQIYSLRKDIKIIENKIIKLTKERNNYEKWNDLQIYIYKKILTIKKKNIYASFKNKDNISNKMSENYKNSKNMIYETPEDLINQLKKCEDEDINLLKKFNKNKYEIDSLKEELEEENNQYLNNYNFKEINDKILLKEKIIDKNKTLERKKLNLSNNNNYFSILDNKLNYPYIKIKHSKLYNKLKLMEKNIFEEKNEDSDFVKNKNEEEEMVKVLKKLEIILDECLKKKEIYSEKYKLKYEKEIEKLEKIKKKKRIILHQKYLKERYIKLKEKIIQKAKKIYFLPNKKINWNWSNDNFKKEYISVINNEIKIKEDDNNYIYYNDITEK